MNKSRIYDAFVEIPWAILPAKLSALAEIVERHVNGEKLTSEEIEARVHGAARPPERRVNKVAVLPLFGSIFPRANLLTEMSGATSAEMFSKKFDELLQNPEIDAIVLDVNSPGGQVGGIAEAAQKIFDARGQKKIVAVANHLMASAAYWIGTAADELVVSPSAEVGSIGVFSAHGDYSKAYEDAGIKVTLISAGKYKTAGNPYEPLDEESRGVIQKRVDDIYDQFVGAVAKHRGVKEATVRNGFGEGSVVGAQEAVKLGMADRIASLDEVINGLFGVSGSGFAKAETPDEDLQVNSSGGQEPAADQSYLQEARARLAQVPNLSITGEVTMFERELLKQREELLARAQALMDGADKEVRDMNDAERAEFEQIMGAGDQPGKLAELDAKIEKVHGEREKLRTAAEKKFGAVQESKAEKPSDTNAGATVMKRAEFDKLDTNAQAAFVKGGGKVQD